MQSLAKRFIHFRLTLVVTILLLAISASLMLTRIPAETAALITVLMAALIGAVFLLARETEGLRQREQELEESEGLLSATVRAAHDGVIVHDEAGRILEFNSAAERLTGYSRAQIYGCEFADQFLPEAIRPLYAETISSASEAETGQRVELDIRRADGTIFPADIGVGATDGAHGRIFALHLRDITRQRGEAAALRAALAGAEAASRAKARFLAMMSHEIRTPLNGVLGALGLLADTELASEQKLYVTTATRSGEALLSLISDILDLSKMEAGKLELDAVDFPFARLMEDVCNILDPAARRHGNSLSIRIDPQIPQFVTGDFGRLRQVLLNFGSNAVKFTTKGRVEIIARFAGGDVRNPTIEFAVTDTGIGIPRDRLDDLFNDFTMIDDSYRRRADGSGLGLAISRRLIKLMGGDCGVESVEGLGSRFWCRLGLAQAEAAAEDLIENEAPPADMQPMKILLVEDNPTNLMVASRMLTADGHHVTMVGDGCEALEAVRAESFDVVLMDISMPEMDGLEATRRIRALPLAQANVPIIAMTAHAVSEDRQRFLAAGMDDYVTKPVRRQKLRQVLSNIHQSMINATLPEPETQEHLPEQVALIDAADIENLKADMGEDLLPSVVTQFVAEMLMRREQAEAAAANHAGEAFRKAVHAVSGSASTIGARRLADLARKLEAQCLAGDAETALADANAFSELLDETAAALRSILPGVNIEAELKAS